MEALCEVQAPPLHAGQDEVRRNPARHRILACGRRWGKTRLAAVLALERALAGGRAWWIGPTYPVASIGWRLLKALTAPLAPEKNETERSLTFSTGGEIWVKSADNPDSLRGEGLDLAIFDECAFIREEAWTQGIRPALTDREGSSIFISTPKGRNWFYRLWVHAGDDGDWARWHYPSASNPHLNPDEIERARAELPERVFQQEYEAMFLEDGAGVFRNVDACIHAGNGGPQDGRSYIVGVDLGKHQDFTVLAVMDTSNGQVPFVDRFGDIDWNIQKARIVETARRWNHANVLIDSTGIGDPILDDLQRQSLYVEGYRFTSGSKQQLIEKLMVSLEQQSIRIPPDPVLIEELKAFEYTTGRTGRVSYSAPPGMHDDTVIALALANWKYYPGIGEDMVTVRGGSHAVHTAARPGYGHRDGTVRDVVDRRKGHASKRLTWR